MLGQVVDGCIGEPPAKGADEQASQDDIPGRTEADDKKIHCGRNLPPELTGAMVAAASSLAVCNRFAN